MVPSMLLMQIAARRETDATLCDRWQRSGDARARARLVSAYAAMVASVAEALPEDARDDLVQEGFLALLRAIDRFQPIAGRSFAAYALRSIRRHVAAIVAAPIDHGAPLDDRDPEVSVEEQILDLAEQLRRRETVDAALTTLSPAERAVVEARHLAVEPTEVCMLARMLGLEPGAVAAIECRGLTRLFAAVGSNRGIVLYAGYRLKTAAVDTANCNRRPCEMPSAVGTRDTFAGTRGGFRAPSRWHAG